MSVYKNEARIYEILKNISFIILYIVILTIYIYIYIYSAVVEERDEQKEFETGPLSVLMQSVKSNSQVRF